MTSERRTFSLARVGRSAFILSAAAAVSQVVAIVRELFLANEEGLSASLDALIIGVTLPITLALALRGGATRALVPAYVEAKQSHGPRGARTLAGVVLVWVGAGGLLLSLLVAALAEPLVSVVAPGLGAAERASAVDYLRLLAPVAFVTCLSGILFSVLQAEEAFTAMAVATVAEPVVTVAVMLSLWDRLGLGALAMGSLCGPIVTLVILGLIAVRRRVMPRPVPWARGLGLPAFVRHALPISISLGLLQIETVADTAVGTIIGPGAVSAMRFAGTLMRAPIGVISSAWGTAVYPALVQAQNDPAGSLLASATSRVLSFVLTFFVPIAALTAAVAPVAVTTAYGRGAFSTEDALLTSQALSALAPMILILMFQPVLTSALNARRKGMILLIASIIDIVGHVLLTVTLGAWIGVIGVALASSISAAVTTVYFARRFRIIDEGFELRPIMRTLALTVAAAAPGAIVIGLLAWNEVALPGLVGGLATLALYGVAGLATYAWLADRLGVSEARTLIDVVLQRLRRATGAPRVA
jgi:putative peptidoglycan lipid II flippase